ncbi:MBL fold metallo-hydrolase [Succinivibrio dextrinosolvens]|uniref:MBL fold metallo-hydrolase n=1 Tax=Succinivibrio dextrinosolvens TaxID=83771 RepID=UPI00241CF642|nr:MBL fold metallo-hydrolase [Succinivibrio dextrinosolvens]MBE6422527.1 MBL fold metallo-hydrolase [Succinivibrio dextrinosolvens]
MIDYKTVFVSPFMQNCRIFYNEETLEACVIDPGDNADRIMGEIKDRDFTLKAILITHMHLDHVGGVHTLLSMQKVPVYGSAIEDRPLYETLDNQAIAFGLDKTESFDTQWVTDGQILEPITGLKFKVITTPGHTPGGVCYYCEEKKLLVSGDTLFAGSIGRTDFPLGDFDDLIDSIKNKLYKLPPQTDVLSGHGPNSTIADEIEGNPYTV